MQPAGEASQPRVADGRLVPLVSASPAISFLALQYAACWRSDRPGQTYRRLYQFNSVPRSPAHQHLLGDPVALRQQLIAAAGVDRADAAAGDYRLGRGGTGSWLSWRNPEARGGSTIVGTRKVYVTVAIDQLPAVLRAVFRVARDAAVPVLKFGADYDNLRRPDRIVIYTRDWGHATAVADALRPVLCGIPATELPFAEWLSTAVYTGLDPPPGSRSGVSWRGWVCRMLADALNSVAEPDPGAAVAVALRRCRDSGIDPDRWAVPDSFFADQPGAGSAAIAGSG
jgi:hypothetical protein